MPKHQHIVVLYTILQVSKEHMVLYVIIMMQVYDIVRPNRYVVITTLYVWAYDIQVVYLMCNIIISYNTSTAWRIKIIGGWTQAVQAYLKSLPNIMARFLGSSSLELQWPSQKIIFPSWEMGSSTNLLLVVGCTVSVTSAESSETTSLAGAVHNTLKVVPKMLPEISMEPIRFARIEAKKS